MTIDFKKIKNEMNNANEWLRREYTQVTTGRATPALLDSVLVSSYGAMQPIKSVASITVEDPRTLRVVPWNRDDLRAIETAVTDSGLPVSVSVDADGVRVSIPAMTAESKEKFVKLVKGKHEEARVTIRMERQRAEKQIESEVDSKDQVFTAKEDLQKIVDEINKVLDETLERKVKDIMTI